MIKNNRGIFALAVGITATSAIVLGAVTLSSLQEFGVDARNSARIADIVSLTEKASIAVAEGVNIMQLVADDTKENTSIALGGAAAGDINDPNKYTAGTPNYSALKISNGSDFQDAQKKVAYPMGATTLSGKTFQLATIQEGYTDVAVVSGNFKARTDQTSTDVSTVDGAAVLASDGTNATGILNIDSGLAILKKGDAITDGTTDMTVVAVSRDLTTVKVTATSASDVNVADNATIGLKVAETAGLIYNTDVVTDGGYVLPY